MKNSAGNRVKHVLNPVEFKGVPCIGSALKARNHVIVPGKDIHNFPFALVAPLQAKEYVSTLHCMFFDLA